MTLDDFRQSLAATEPPAGVSLAALWWDAKGRLDASPRIWPAGRSLHNRHHWQKSTSVAMQQRPVHRTRSPPVFRWSHRRFWRRDPSRISRDPP